LADIPDRRTPSSAGNVPNGPVSVRAADGAARAVVKPDEHRQNERLAPAVGRRSADRFRALIESSEDTIVLLDANGTIQWASPSINRDIDYSLDDEFLGHGAFEFIHPQDQPALMSAFTNLVSEYGKCMTGEFRTRRKDGTWRWIQGSAKNLLHDPRLQAIVCNYRDITDRKIAEEAVRRSEQHFRSLIENASDIITVLEPNGSIRYMSPSIERVAGLVPEEIVSSTIFQLVHPDDISGITAAIAQAVRTPGVPQSAQFRVQNKNGEWRYLEGVGRALVDESGAPFGVINVRDVTERVAAEANLLKEKSFSVSLIDSLPGIFYLFNDRGTFLRWNKNMEDASGHSAQEISEMSPLDFIREDHRAIVAQRIQKVFTEGHATAEADFLSKDGSGAPYFFTGRLATLDGEQCLVGVGIDVTDRVAALEALRSSEERYRELFENANDIVYTYDLSGRFTSINRTASEVTGYKRDEVMNMNISEIVAPEHLEMARRMVARKVHGGRSSAYELEIVTKDGRRVPLEVSSRLVYKDGQAVGTQGIARDISERRQSEEALRASTESLKALTAALEQRVAERTAELTQTNEELEAFAFSVSHDLRAQLRAMRGFGEAVLEDYGAGMDAATRDFTSRVVATTGEMDILIQAILDYGRINRMDLQSTPLPLKLIVGEALDQNQGEISARGAVVSAAQTPNSVIGHGQSLVQVVANLISNAIRFVPEGTPPQVKIWAEARRPWVRLWVEDNGIGIADENHERIFGIFERLHGVEDYPGTGIGLAIVRRSVERMGGRVGVESTPGRGSRFWIELRAPKRSPKPARARRQNAGKGRHKG
jgi:PAS domain S-box-containing protein